MNIRWTNKLKKVICLTKVSSDLKEDFKRWRSSKGMTQKEVAIKLAVNHQIINKFESGQLNNDPKLVSKIKRLIKN